MQQPGGLGAEISEYIANVFDALDRGMTAALVRLEAPRRYRPELAERALETLVTSLTGYAIGLVGASVAGGLARHAERAVADAVRDELARVAASPLPVEVARPASRELERAFARPRMLAVEDLRELLRERVLHARAHAHAIVVRLVGAALAAAPHDRAGVARVLLARHADDLVPYRFGERIETAWRATCEHVVVERAAPRPTPAPPLAALAEPAENYCWMRIR